VAVAPEHGPGRGGRQGIAGRPRRCCLGSDVVLQTSCIPMRAQTQLELLRNLDQRRHRANRGFTLVELMITVAIVGILSAVALPQFLKARARAQAGAAVGEVIGLAKQCAVGNASKLSETLKDGAGTAVTCNGSADVSMVSQTFSTNAEGVQCLASSMTSASSSTKATITVKADGAMSCLFS